MKDEDQSLSLDPDTDDDRPDYYETCKHCGDDLPHGASRRLGVCVWCIKKSNDRPPVIPRMCSYGRNSE